MGPSKTGFPNCGVTLPRIVCATLLLLVASSAAPCAAETQSEERTLVVAAADEETRARRAGHSDSPFGDYLAGVVANSRRDLGPAANFLLRVLEWDPEDENLRRGAFVLSAAGGRHAEAARLGRQVLADRPGDMAASLVLAVDSIERGDLKSASTLLAELPDRGLGKVGTPLIQAWVKSEQGHRAEASALIKKVEEVNGFGVIASLHSALMHDLSGEAGEAEAAYRKAIEVSQQPSLRLAWLFGSFLERQDRVDEAIDHYRSFQERNRSLDLLGPAEERQRGGTTPMPIVRDFKDGIAEVLFSLATLLKQESADEMALIQSHLALRLRPGFEMDRLLLGEILEDQGRGEEAIEVYREIDPASPFSWSARLRAAEQLDDLDQTEKAIAELDLLAETRPGRYEPHFRRGNLLRAQERFEEAVTAYDEAFARIDEVTEPLWSMLYFRGIALERSGVWNRAESDFLKALELVPEQPYVMNYLAYSWVEQETNFERAEKMLLRAVELRPTDGFIVDSLGWVYYRRGNYEDAVTQLERAVELRPQDPVINDHLGDAFWKVGRSREARFQWRRALSLKPETDLVPMIEAKIKDGLESMPEKI